MRKIVFFLLLISFLSSYALAFSVAPETPGKKQSQLARFSETIIIREKGFTYKSIAIYIEAFDQFHNLLGPAPLKAGEDNFLRVRVKNIYSSPVYLKIQKPFSSWYNQLSFSALEPNFDYSNSPIEFKNRKKFFSDWDEIAYSFEYLLPVREEVQFYVMLQPQASVNPELEFSFLFAIDPANKGFYENYSELRERVLFFIE